jgi:hypothetical protein
LEGRVQQMGTGCRKLRGSTSIGWGVVEERAPRIEGCRRWVVGVAVEVRVPQTDPQHGLIVFQGRVAVWQ